MIQGLGRFRAVFSHVSKVINKRSYLLYTLEQANSMCVSVSHWSRPTVCVFLFHTGVFLFHTGAGQQYVCFCFTLDQANSMCVSVSHWIRPTVFLFYNNSQPKNKFECLNVWTD